MGVVHFVLSDELEVRLRRQVRRKGDLSRMAEEALDAYLTEKENKGSRK